MRRFLAGGLAIVMVLALPVLAEEPRKPVVAVFDIEDQGGSARLSKGLLDRLSNYLATRLAEVAGYAVVPRADLQKRLLEQKKSSYRRCYDQSCQIELGRELAAQKSVSAQIMRIGKRCTVTLNVFDLQKATSETAATSERGGCDEEGLVGLLDQVADKIAGKAPAASGNAAAAVAAPAVAPSTVTKYDFLGRWSFLHAGKVSKVRDLKDQSITECEYDHYWVDFTLDGSGELSFRLSDRCRCTGRGRADVWEHNYPGRCGSDRPPELIPSGYDDYTVELVKFIDDLKVVAVTTKQLRTGSLDVRNYALTPDKQKLVPVHGPRVTYAAQGKLDEIVKAHLVETIDPQYPDDAYTSLTYAMKEGP